MYRSTKLFDGFSCCFRQWKAETTHCRFMHGYGVSFRVTFEGGLDHRNWVWDFGGMKRAKGQIDGMSPKDWFGYMFDHTIVVAVDDPKLEEFKKLDAAGVAQVRIVPATGAEKFAEFIYDKVNPFIAAETQNRVKVIKVEFREHGKNAAAYLPFNN
mgnify:FL=1